MEVRPVHRVRRPLFGRSRRAALLVMGAACAESTTTTTTTTEPPSSPASRAPDVLGPLDWRRFPLIFIDVDPAQLGEVAALADVAAYYTSFAPFEPLGGVLPTQAAAASLRLERAAAAIAQAEATGLHVTVTLPLLAHPRALTEADPLLRGDAIVSGGRLFVNPAVVPGCTDGSEPACIEVPTRFDDVTPAYLAYWSAKLPSFLAAVTAADPQDRVWGFYGPEEVRHWGPEYPALHHLRDALDADVSTRGRPLIAYQPHNRMPENLAWTLLRTPPYGDGPPLPFVHAPPSPRSFLTTWSAPGCSRVGPGCAALALTGYYPRAMAFARDGGGALRPLQTHLLRGNYQGALLLGQAHRNRIGSFHRVDVERQTLAGVELAYAASGEVAPSHLAFHLPDLNLCTLAAAQTTPAEARHDFWSGVHRGQGIFLYNYDFVAQARSGAFTSSCAPAALPEPAHLLEIWREYATGLRLIKQQLRPFLVQGLKTEPFPFDALVTSELDVIPGTDYLIDEPIAGADTTLAMPSYPAVQGSAYRLGDTVLLIVTSAFDQNARWRASFGAPICAFRVLHGEPSTAAISGAQLVDSFPGIEGRAYLVELGATCP
jgi:hypothetical protein